MPLESATVIPQLDPDNPLGSDPISNGDNHVRLIKSVLVNQLGSLGTGLLTVSATQINAAAASSGQYSTGTSTTSLLIGVGSKSFTTQPNRGFAVGQVVRITSNANVANYMQGQVTAYDSTTGAMTVLVATVGGSGTFADWSIAVYLDSRQYINRSTRTANSILSLSDIGTWVDITANTFTQTFDAAATLGAGWWCYLGNSGTGDITLDPNGAELIDGLATYVMYPSEVRLVTCDGTGFRTIVLKSYYKTFTASGTYTTPPGYSAHAGKQWGGGAAGDRRAVGTQRLGGGGGACAEFHFLASAMGVTESVTIGAGGIANAIDSSAGAAGSISLFKGVVAYGAVLGAGGAGGNAYIANPGDFNAAIAGASLTTRNGFYGGGAAAVTGSTFGDTVHGGGAGNGITAANALTTAGATVFGGAGGTTNAAGTTPTAGTAPGGGGGASTNGTVSGAGARGELRIWGIG